MSQRDLSSVSRVVLDMPVASLLCREKHTGAFRVAAYKANIRTVEDLLSTPEEELYARVSATDQDKQSVKKTLEALGLHLS